MDTVQATYPTIESTTSAILDLLGRGVPFECRRSELLIPGESVKYIVTVAGDFAQFLPRQGNAIIEIFSTHAVKCSICDICHDVVQSVDVIPHLDGTAHPKCVADVVMAGAQTWKGFGKQHGKYADPRCTACGKPITPEEVLSMGQVATPALHSYCMAKTIMDRVNVHVTQP